MSESVLVDAFRAAVEVRHPAYICDGIPDAWEPVSRPEPCERCGTTVVALRDTTTHAVDVFEIGPIRPSRAGCRMDRHKPTCKALRVEGGLW